MVKWGGLLGAVILLVVWVGSGWWWHGWYGQGGQYRGGYVSVSEGRLTAGSRESIFRWLVHPQSMPGELIISPSEQPGFKWWFYWNDDSLDTSFGTPIWILALGAVLMAAYARRLDELAWRRDRVGVCARCDYDRSGLAVGAVCPECGAAASEACDGARG